jgi:glycosyltransferase involved in cell wall biosynthesis
MLCLPNSRRASLLKAVCRKIEFRQARLCVRLAIRTRHGAVLLYVGRVSEEKGLRTLLRAFAEIRMPLRLQVIGEGPLDRVVQDAARTDARIE